MKRCLLLVGLLACSAAYAQQTVLEVIALKYRSSSELIPVLQPLLAKEGTLSGLQNQLMVRTTPDNLAQIKRVLATVDVAPRRLLVTVQQVEDAGAAKDTAELSGSVALGDSARLSVPPAGGESGGLTVEARQGRDSVSARIDSTEALRRGDTLQQVQVLEGSRALIEIGRLTPLPEQTVIYTASGVRVIESTHYRDTVTGFYVVPRVVGDDVTLQIETRRELPQAAGGSVAVEQVTSTLAGRLGVWMDVGLVAGASGGVQSGVAVRTEQSVQDRRRIMIKVEEAR